MSRRGRLWRGDWLRNLLLVVASVAVVAFAGYVALRDQAAPQEPTSAPTLATPTPTPSASPAPPWKGALVDVAFTKRPDGPPGDPFVLSPGRGGPDSLPRVVDGALTIASEGPAAGYAQLEPDARPSRIGAEFRFGEGSADGAICLAFWDRLIPEPFEVPDSGMHLALGPDRWIYGVWEGGEFAQVDSGALSEPLVRGDLYTLEVAVEGTTAVLTLPDGTTERVTDPRIATIPARVLNWEHYLGAAGDATSAFTRVWAD